MSAKSTKKNACSRTNTERLHRRNDDDIDYTDNPATDSSFWADAEILMPRSKKHISLRLDEDILSYFQEEGGGYQSRINAVLKAYMHAHPHHK